MNYQVIDEQLAVRNGANIAGAAALLEVGARLGVLQIIDNEDYIDSKGLAENCYLSESATEAYLFALTSAGLLECSGHADRQSTPMIFKKTVSYDRFKAESSYVLWALSACRPFIEHARDFLSAPSSIPQEHPRDGGLVAMASAWTGGLDYYPPSIEVISKHNPSLMVDLGSGSGGLLIEILKKLPQALGIGVDLNPTACAQARRQATVAGVGDRLTIYERSIQSLVTDQQCLEGADLITAGFVIHDLFPDYAEVAAQLFKTCYNVLKPKNGILLLTEFIPYIEDDRERMFSAILTFFHQEFMKRKLPTESEWTEKLRNAGFEQVNFHRIPMPGARLIVARCTKS